MEEETLETKDIIENFKSQERKPVIEVPKI